MPAGAGKWEVREVSPAAPPTTPDQQASEVPPAPTASASSAPPDPTPAASEASPANPAPSEARSAPAAASEAPPAPTAAASSAPPAPTPAISEASPANPARSEAPPAPVAVSDIPFALAALNAALWTFFIAKRWRVVWESDCGRSFALGAFGARSGTWQELARIDWLRGTVADDQANAWWEQLFNIVPAFRQLASDSYVSSRNTRGNVVEACVGASFLASHEHKASLVRQGSACPRFRFRTQPPEALAHAAAIFPLFRNLGVRSPALRRPDAWERRSPRVPAEIRVAEPDAAAGSRGPQQ